MAYECPRCGGAVSRGSSGAARVAGGVVGMLIFAAFGSFQCAKCGKIPKKEFPPEVRSKMMRGSIIMVVIALVLLAGVLAVVVAINS